MRIVETRRRTGKATNILHYTADMTIKCSENGDALVQTADVSGTYAALLRTNLCQGKKVLRNKE